MSNNYYTKNPDTKVQYKVVKIQDENKIKLNRNRKKGLKYSVGDI